MIRLYVKSPLDENQEVSLSENQSHYLQKVMRLRLGDEVLLFNGVNGEWRAQITEILKKSTLLQLISQTRPQKQEGDLWLLFSPLKPKRQEFLVEKATELGASCFCPIRFERTSQLKLNVEKIESHIIEAAEQCERLTIPSVKPLTSFSDLLQNWPEERILIFGDETLNSPSLGSLEINPLKQYAFLVGPEGGLSHRELSLLRSHPNAKGVTLNSHILRSETAALVGVSYLQMRMGF